MADRQRRDLFGECNVEAHPIDVFVRDCCANCINPECTRSLAGKLKFDARTATWFDRYFGDKDPKMDPGDARFPQIAAQRFIVIDPGLTGRAPEVGSSSWVDPRDLPKTTAPAPVIVAPTAPQVVSAPAAVPQPGPNLRQVPKHLLLANTSAQNGKIIGPPSAREAPNISPKDPWAAPVPDATDGTPVISPGSRVKMGGGGV